MPFLWVLLLAIYLARFILTFDGRGGYWRRSCQTLAALAAALMMTGLVYRPKAGWSPEQGLAALVELCSMRASEPGPVNQEQ